MLRDGGVLIVKVFPISTSWTERSRARGGGSTEAICWRDRYQWWDPILNYGKLKLRQTLPAAP
jgi:hypothetical protein